MIVPGDHLTVRDHARLVGGDNSRRICAITPHRDGWRITAGAIVGVLRLARIQLNIGPKMAFTGNSLLRWTTYAMNVPVPHKTTTRAWQTDPTGFTDLVAAALLAECRSLLGYGLRRDYVRNARTSPVLRGRLDVMAQATERYGMLDTLHVQTFDREMDIWENRLCGHALRAAGKAVADPRLARELISVADEFPAAGSVATVLRAQLRARYTPLNLRYRPAHLWSALILRGGGVSDLLIDAGNAADSFLLDMPRLWEKVVVRLTSDSAPAFAAPVSPTGRSRIEICGDLSNQSSFRPDILFRMQQADGDAMLPIEAKYKHYHRTSLAAADLHQLLTYVAGYAPEEAPIAAIIHPAPESGVFRTVRVHGNRRELGAVRVIGVDTALPPAAAAEWLRAKLWTDGSKDSIEQWSNLRGLGAAT
ncbi:McrC family protein [Nocardia rhamnosiphila]